MPLFQSKQALRSIFLIFSCYLCGYGGQEARAQAVVSLTPRHGEIRLTGTVTRIEKEQNRFILMATRVMTADGTENALPQAKPKSIVTSSATTVGAVLSPESAAVPFVVNELSELPLSAFVFVIGRIGANGIIAARLVCLFPSSTQNASVEEIEESRPPSDPPGKNLLLPTDVAESWSFTAMEPAQAHIEPEEGSVKVTVTGSGKEDWRVQLSQTGAFPEPGVSYTLSFRARAEPARRMRVSAQVLGSDFHDIGINRVAQLSGEWVTYEYPFVARNLGAKGHLLPVFFFGTQKGTTWLSEVTLAVSYPQKRGNLLESVANPGAWKLVPQNKEGRAALRVKGASLEVSTFEVGKQARDIAYQLLPSAPPLLLPGRSYLLTFSANSGAERSLRIRGIAEPVKLTAEERPFEIRFRVSRLTDFGVFPTFVIGDQIGPFILRDLILKEERRAVNPAKPGRTIP